MTRRPKTQQSGVSVMRFGELLVNHGFITKEQLEEGLRIQSQSKDKKKLGMVLMELGYISERQIVEVLEFQLGFPAVSLLDTRLETDVLELLPEAIARKHTVFPVRKSGERLVLAMTDPLDYIAIEEVRLATSLPVQPVITTASDIEQAIARFYGLQGSAVKEIEEDFVMETDDVEQEALNQSSPVVRLVNQIIQAAVAQRASDIHIEPEEHQVVIRFRVDGVLRVEQKLPKTMQNVLTARLKILAKLNITERRLPQDGRIQFQVDGKRVDIRVSTLPGVTGESIVLRILDQSIGVKQLSELGFSDHHYTLFEKVLHRPNGIILISGPTGSGKSSTLYSALQMLNKPDVKIITVEDPVEYRIEGITQVQVHSQIGLTFASGLRSILRQDPNIVMVGEIRDSETAEIAVRASLTGHLVFSTIHTNSAISTITRLVDMEIEHYLIASSLNCVVAQRLVRRVCRECAVSVPARPDEMQLFAENGLLTEQWLESTGTDHQSRSEPLMLTRGKGCASCGKTGFKGRIAIHEVLVLDEGMRRLIAGKASLEELTDHAMAGGFRTLLRDGLEKVMGGLTTTEELLKAVTADE